jgi:mannose-6-phosphate isomerase-like protein (cupin superfamily)
MYTVVSESDFELRPGGTIKFVGDPHGSGVSFFHVKNRPGTGAALHRHPYAETWVVLKGHVRFTIGDEDIEATAGNIVVGGANIPHKFVSLGPDVLEAICIHPSSVIIQEDLV